MKPPLFRRLLRLTAHRSGELVESFDPRSAHIEHVHQRLLITRAGFLKGLVGQNQTKHGRDLFGESIRLRQQALSPSHEPRHDRRHLREPFSSRPGNREEPLDLLPFRTVDEYCLGGRRGLLRRNNRDGRSLVGHSRFRFAPIESTTSQNRERTPYHS